MIEVLSEIVSGLRVLALFQVVGRLEKMQRGAEASLDAPGAKHLKASGSLTSNNIGESSD